MRKSSKNRETNGHDEYLRFAFESVKSLKKICHGKKH